jgi:CubicO group peptidase (beta-lactamase class C family)
LIQQGERILYEQYFHGFSYDTPHDTRSATKSFASALTGIAIEEGSLEDEQQLIKPFYDDSYPDIDWSAGKSDINLFHLLTMSSGIDAIDFGLSRNSFANEGNYQNQEDWSSYILSAPMVSPPGEHANYGSGNPHLLGEVLANVVDKRLPFYVHQQLLGPLGIKNYRLQTDDKGLPYFGGGWYMTARDLAAFGRLYLQQGVWEGQQVLSKEWVRKSMQQHLNLENTIDQNPYGYFFWHKTYQIGNQSIASIEARGSGGQYLFMVPEYDLVVVIFSGNYRNNKFAQPERIMQDYILPEIE